MKCTPVRLLNRSEQRKNRWKLNRSFHKNIEPAFTTQGCQGSPSPIPNKEPILSVKNLQLPENFNTYNTGYSLERWSKKAPRLKSGNKSVSTKNSEAFQQDYDITFDMDNILDCLEANEFHGATEIPYAEEYEANSDIEELLQKSQGISDEERERRKRKEKRSMIEEKLRTGNKHKLKKTIRFSFSKPASPKTEQIIRVDVTSTISAEELRQIERGEFDRDDYSRGHMKMTNEARKELDGLNENGIISFDAEDEEFIVRCSQLALTQKKR